MREKSKGTTKCEKRTVICDARIAQCDDGTIKYEKRTVICDVGTVQCEDETVKCEKKVTWCSKLPTKGYRIQPFFGGVQ